MNAPAESSPRGVFVSHLSIKECGQAWRALVNWWDTGGSHNLIGEAGGLIPFAVTLHELSETAHSLERRSADAVAATGVSVAETGAADPPGFDIGAAFLGMQESTGGSRVFCSTISI